jgi:hypothetical protein
VAYIQQDPYVCPGVEVVAGSNIDPETGCLRSLLLIFFGPFK